MKFLDELLLDPDDTWLASALGCDKENVGQLKALEQRLRAIYGSYGTAIQNFGSNLADTQFETEKKILLEYYGSPPAELSRWMKSRRNYDDLGECPYCGYPFTPDTLDHFIPKDSWPEFSFYPNNLVPQCRGCAPTKGEHYYCTEDNTAKFIHPFYFNTISKLGFKITVGFTRNKPSFEIVFTRLGELTPPEEERLKRHVRHLKIKKRIVEYCGKAYRRWLSRARERKFDMALAFNEILKHMDEGAVSRNWETAFLKGMLENNDVIIFLQSQMPQGASSQPKVTILNI